MTGIPAAALPEPLKNAQAFLNSPLDSAVKEFETAADTLIRFLDDAAH